MRLATNLASDRIFKLLLAVQQVSFPEHSSLALGLQILQRTAVFKGEEGICPQGKQRGWRLSDSLRYSCRLALVGGITSKKPFILISLLALK